MYSNFHVIKTQHWLTQAYACCLLPFWMVSWIRNLKFTAPCDLEIKQLEIKVSTQYDLEKKKKKIHYAYSICNVAMENQWQSIKIQHSANRYTNTSVVSFRWFLLIDRGWELWSTVYSRYFWVSDQKILLYMKYWKLMLQWWA